MLTPCDDAPKQASVVRFASVSSTVRSNRSSIWALRMCVIFFKTRTRTHARMHGLDIESGLREVL